MLEKWYIDNGAFVPFSTEHYISIAVCIILGIIILFWAKKFWNENQKKLYITILVLLGLILQIAKPIIKYQLGIFDHTEHLPLHLCNILPFFMAPIMYYKWRTGWAIIFFWIMAGTFQGLFTPSLIESFPHYESWRYWLIHGGLSIAALYGIYIYKWKLKWKDMIFSMIALNLLAAIIYPINITIDANYLYLLKKPPGKTMYDLLGPWPYYILSLEIVMTLMFSMMVLPFQWKPIKNYLTGTSKS